MAIAVVQHSERPELWEDTEARTREIWPEYNLHGEILNRYWGRLFEDFRDFQFIPYDDMAREVLAEGHSVPCPWDGTIEGLGEGIDTRVAAAAEAHEARRRPSALCSLAAEILPRFQGRGLADRILDVRADLAAMPASRI